MIDALIGIIAYGILPPLLVIVTSIVYNYVRFCLIKPGYRLHSDPVWDPFNEYVYTSTVEVRSINRKGPFTQSVELDNDDTLTFWKAYCGDKYSL